MFSYLTSYRYYTLAKIGFGLAYLWFVLDFLRIHIAVWNQLSPLLSAPDDITFSGNQSLDIFFRRLAIFLSGKVMVWIFTVISPLAVGLYVWGRYRWLQFATGCWMSFSMISLNSLVGVFNSTADIWLNYVFLIYGLTALVRSNVEWENCEPGLNMAKWRDEPVLASTYAWLVVLLQFTVYFFAGINKLIYGWSPWIKGVALQNLAFDSSMHEFIRGVHVPYLISLILCYVTLFQRLVVPFGFFFKRFRIWSVLILGTMHIGYAILMSVNLFPVVGIASLLMILPPRTWELSKPFLKQRVKKRRQTRQGAQQANVAPSIFMGLFSLWLLLESARLTMFRPTPWENKLMIVPTWRMFADGGVTAGGKWRFVMETPQGEVDGTEIAIGMLPGLWRDRFYIDDIFHEILNQNTGPGSLPEKLAKATEEKYSNRQRLANANPLVLSSGFDIYSSVKNAH
jgi:Vitamin K-dependent gamma-carboxylase